MDDPRDTCDPVSQEWCRLFTHLTKGKMTTPWTPSPFIDSQRGQRPFITEPLTLRPD